MINSLSSADIDRSAVDRFRTGLEKISQMGKCEGLDIRPYASPDLPGFQALPQDARAKVSEALDVYLDVLSQLKSEGQSLTQNLNGVWYTLRRCGFVPPSDLMNRINANDFVEIYTSTGIQIFRSFHFFKICSYDLDTLFCSPFIHLYTRGDEVDAKLAYYLSNVSEETLRLSEKEVAHEHLVRERVSLNKFCLSSKTKFVCALKDKFGTLKGFIHVFESRLVGKES